MAEARDRGVAPQPLRATLYSGQSVKTDKVGWYLRKNQSLAIGEDGSYYILTVPGGLRERIAGVKLTPSPPPLIVGKGGRDGESGDLAEFLRWRLGCGLKPRRNSLSKGYMSSVDEADFFTFANLM